MAIEFDEDEVGHKPTEIRKCYVFINIPNSFWKWAWEKIRYIFRR